jgi:pimeloyl-ACP methyl ester carboxylesterase
MLVLLVHGLGRTPLSMFGLAAALRRAGHRTRFFGYLPTLESVPRIVARLTRLLRRFGGGPVGLVGHSLGGLLLRRALADVPELRDRRLVLLGSPQVPARAAQLASRFPPFRWLTRGCGRFLCSTEVVPIPRGPYTLVAGTAGPVGRWSPFGNEPNDGLVGVAETRLVATDEPVRVPALHTFLMDHPGVREAVVAAMMTPT